MNLVWKNLYYKIKRGWRLILVVETFKIYLWSKNVKNTVKKKVLSYLNKWNFL